MKKILFCLSFLYILTSCSIDEPLATNQKGENDKDVIFLSTMEELEALLVTPVLPGNTLLHMEEPVTTKATITDAVASGCNAIAMVSTNLSLSFDVTLANVIGVMPYTVYVCDIQ
ncbi:MAG: hypothetical protein LIP06_07890 [Tannerellaceae bacterium]|nr:hypothetical protein [Tannerellaceae bacterium]